MVEIEEETDPRKQERLKKGERGGCTGRGEENQQCGTATPGFYSAIYRLSDTIAGCDTTADTAFEIEPYVGVAAILAEALIVKALMSNVIGPGTWKNGLADEFIIALHISLSLHAVWHVGVTESDW